MTSKINYFDHKSRPSRLLGSNPGAFTGLELDVYVQKQIILHTIDKALYKLELAACLPLLLANDCKLLKPLLTEKELALIVECALTRFSVQNSRNPQEENLQQIRKSIQKLQKIKQRDNVMAGFGSFFVLSSKKSYVDVNVSTSKREDPGMSRVIHMLCSKPRARLRKLIKDKHSELSPGCLNLLRHFYQLRNLVSVRLNTSPAAVIRRDRELRFVWCRNEKAKLKIKKLGDELKRQKSKGLTLLEKRDELITQQRIKLVKEVNECKNAIQNIVKTSETRMVAQCTKSESKVEELVQDVKGANFKLASVLQANLQQEKNLRVKRLKIESQLAAWIDKYDQDIRDKQTEWDDIKAGFEAEIQEMLTLQEEFDIQEDDYEKLMAEKEAEYQHELEEKMFIFIFNRAARRIQKYWRAYRERKLARKKKHKGKKGKGSGKTK